MAVRALVTGAAGFAGGHLIDLLAGEGQAVVAWYRPGGHQPRSVAGVTWDAVDLNDRTAVAAALDRAQPDVVYHCAGAPHVGHSFQKTLSTFETNVHCTHRLFEAMRATGRPLRVVVTSSAMVYASANEALHEDSPLIPSSPYGVSKLAQEIVAREDPGPLRVSIARAFNHFGPRQSPGFVSSDFARRIADIEAGRFAPEIAVGNLDARRDLTDVRDTVRAYRLMADGAAPGAIYNVCSGRAVVIRDLLDMLLRRARVKIEVKTDPARLRPSDQPLVLGSPARIERDLGWTAGIPLEQTLDDVLAYWRAQAASGA